MLRKAVAGLAGLGLIGGAGSVIYKDNGDAVVQIRDKNTGKVQSVQIGGAHGRWFSCPAGTRDKVEPFDITLGRIKLTLRQLRRKEHGVEQRYPSHYAPSAFVDSYRALLRRDHRLVSAFNVEMDKRNAVIDQECTAN